MEDLGANWRLENAKSPAAMLQLNNPDATCMHACMSVPRMCLVYSCTCDSCVYVRLEACDYGAFVWRMTNGHKHWVGVDSSVLDASGWKKQFQTPTASSVVEQVVEVTAVFGHVSHTDIHTKIVSSRRRSVTGLCQRYLGNIKIVNWWWQQRGKKKT